MAAKQSKKDDTAEATESAGKKDGGKVILPNGTPRIDFIRDRYYKDGVARGDIRKEVNAMLKEADRGEEEIPYQIVFAATKTGTKGDPKTDPRAVSAAKAKDAAAASSDSK